MGPANPKLRYERVVLRKSSTDQVSYEKFISDEEREINNEEPHKQNLKECIKRADYILMNDDTLEGLHLQVDELLEKEVKSSGNSGSDEMKRDL